MELLPSQKFHVTSALELVHLEMILATLRETGDVSIHCDEGCIIPSLAELAIKTLADGVTGSTLALEASGEGSNPSLPSTSGATNG